MNQNFDIENEEIKAEKADDLGWTRERAKEVSPRSTLDGFKIQGSLLIIGGASILILVIVFILLFKGHEKALTGDLNSVRVNLDKVGLRLSHIEGQVAGLQKYLTNLHESGSAVKQSLDQLSQEIHSLQKEVDSFAKKVEAPLGIPRKPTAQTGKAYHEVRPGDTLYRIAKKYGISVDELRGLNAMSLKQVIQPGQKLFVPLGKP